MQSNRSYEADQTAMTATTIVGVPPPPPPVEPPPVDPPPLDPPPPEGGETTTVGGEGWVTTTGG
jgi:hypothetical protein